MIVNLLSKHRSELMGLSIIMIMLFHTIGGVPIPGFPFFKPFICFDFGVEFFIILSALGCTYSLEKNSDTISFYQRRFRRIVPAFLIVVALDFVLYDFVLTGNSNPLNFFKKLFFISFFEGDISFWFILYIMMCYILTPYVHKRRNSKILLLITGIATILILVFCFKIPQVQNVLLFRIPIFFIALLLINYVRNYKSGLNLVILGIVTLAVYASLVFCIRYPYKYLVYMLTAIPCLIFLAMILDKVKSERVRLMLSFMGGISLELYLIHEKLLYFSDMISTNIAFRIVFSFSLAIVLSYLLHVGLSKIKILKIR